MKPSGDPAGVAAAFPVMPSGTVSFLFTDIESSTSRWERDRAAMSSALRRHDALMHAILRAHGGSIFKTVGDAFCCAFSNIDDAVAAASAAQRALAAEDFSAVEGLRVRMALHAGSAEERDGDYFGPTVNRLARLLAAAHGGQIVLSEAGAALARATLGPGYRLLDLGEHRLKDLTNAERVFQLAFDDLPSDFPPLRSLSFLDNNLPLHLTRLLGRDADLDELGKLVRENRLVTIAGTAGVGKTRAALGVAANLLDRSPDGVWFVDLALFRDPSFVSSAVAVGIGAAPTADGDVLDVVIAFLKRRRLLLVIDNCEHVIDEAARVIGAILESCGDVRILATSREPLKIRGERVYRIPSLPVPPQTFVDRDGILGYAACALYVERATSIDRTFRCTQENAPAIGELCRRLDGIPLAIELAAARVRVFSPASLVQRLSERFRVLADGTRGALPRQKTMRALIDWSYDLLSPHERCVFNRCSVFAGGWTVEAAEALCAISELGPFDVLDTLSALVDKSLVVVNYGDESLATRFTYLESMRAYAYEKLLETSEQAAAFEAHARWVAGLFAKARRLEATQRWHPEAALEADNVLVALGWALQDGNDPVLAGRIAGDAGALWYEGGFAAAGRQFIEASLARIDPEREPAIASRLWQLLAILRYANDAADAARRALALAERAGDKVAMADALRYLGFGLWQCGRPEEAERELRRAIALHRETGTERSIAHASALDALANVLAGAGRTVEARACFDRALGLFRSVEDRLGVALVQGNFAELEFAGGDAEEALRRVAEPIVVFREMRATVREATALVNSAAYLVFLRRVDEARSAAFEALAIGRRARNAQIVAVAMQHLAAVAALAGEVQLAARLLGYVDGWYGKQGFEQEQSERSSRRIVESILQGRLCEAQVAELMSNGATFNEDDAVNETQPLLRLSAPI